MTDEQPLVPWQRSSPAPGPASMRMVREMRDEFVRLRMEYRSAADEVLTKVSILRNEFVHLHRYNPIEHVGSRVKTPASILDKALRYDLDLTPAAIREGITDIAGVRIVCSFISDTYQVLEALMAQTDLRVLTIKDYIAEPKPSGYKSVHLILEVPVFLTSGPVPVPVEVQIRTIAMDFWASLDHKIQYKYDGDVPDHLAASLAAAADTAGQLDRTMEDLHREVHGDGDSDDAPEVLIDGFGEELLRRLWARTQG